jgi:transcriptional regulator with XRE-family HTH domain
MTFGEKLQSLRKQSGLSQERLASQLTVSRQAISKWELDSSLPDIENIIQISKLFNVSIDYLLDDDIENTDDIAIVKENTIAQKSKFHNPIEMIIGIICAGIGLLGNITLLVLSTLIQVPVTKKLVMPDGSVSYYGGGDVLGYSFWGFIENYHLIAILIIFVILLVVGTILIVRSKKGTKLHTLVR